MLVDVGTSMKRINQGLSDVGLTVSDLDAIIITHTHSDHVQGLKVIQKHITCPIFMSDLSYRNISLSANSMYDNIILVLPGKKLDIIDGISLSVFATSHNCDGSIGLLIKSKKASIGYATDLGVVPDEMMHLFKGADHIVIESNYDFDMLINGTYPWPLKERIMSDEGHLSNKDCADAIAFFAQNGTKDFYLAHLSEENNNPALARCTVIDALAGYSNISITTLNPKGNEVLLFE